MSDVALRDALDRLVPDCTEYSGDWEEVLRLAGLAPVPVGEVEPTRAWRRRRRWVALAAAAAALVVLLVTPAFGIGGLLLDLIGRTNVPFAGSEPAPLEVKREFFDLSLGVPPEMGPQAIASEARRVGEFRGRGRVHVLYVAPTENGGYCWTFTGALLGCHSTRPVAGTTKPRPGQVAPHRLGVSWIGRVTSGGRRSTPPSLMLQVSGDLRARDADKVQVEYEDGSRTDIPFVYVSKPIDAGFFLYEVPDGHERPGSRARAVRVLDREGRVLARQPITYRTARDVPRRPRLPRPVRPVLPRIPRLPAPTPPLVRSEVGGVVVTVGRNAVAVFDTSGATPDVRRMIAGRATYACFSFMLYQQASPARIGFWRETQPQVSIRAAGLDVPFDGCEIEAGHGHVWPDRIGSHGAVEIAFNARAQRYFTDRAAARDLALFVRSDEMHRIRKLTGESLRAALRQRYGTAITELPSATAPLRPKRIGYVVREDGVTFVERSETGRLFHVVIRSGRIATQNVTPLGFVF